jgi:hypothetical protein
MASGRQGGGETRWPEIVWPEIVWPEIVWPEIMWLGDRVAGAEPDAERWPVFRVRQVDVFWRFS